MGRLEQATRRTKASVADTMDVLWMATASTKVEERDKWLVLQGAAKALSMASGIVAGGLDDAKFQDDEVLIKMLSKDLRNVVQLFRDAIEDGREPWEERRWD